MFCLKIQESGKCAYNSCRIIKSVAQRYLGIAEKKVWREYSSFFLKISLFVIVPESSVV